MNDDTTPTRRVPLDQDVEIDLGRFEYCGVEIKGRVRVRADMLERLRSELGSAVIAAKTSKTLNRISNAVQLVGTVIDRVDRSKV